MKKFENTNEWIIKLFNQIIKSFWDIEKYKIKHTKTISSIFLAWAPWSWKTEFLDTIFKDLKKNFIVIDLDKYRKLFKWYNWENASKYQKSSVKIADKILKYCFKNNLNFVFDGTFRNYNKVQQNLEQCKKYNRKSLITFIFQEPRISFYYTFLRKINKKRNVPIEIFIDWFYNSILNIFKAKNEFKNIDLIIANKRYNFLNKNKYIYKIEYKVKDLKYFCNTHRIVYKKWEFKNKENLKFDLQKFQSILETRFLFRKNTIFSRMKFWFIEKFYKL